MSEDGLEDILGVRYLQARDPPEEADEKLRPTKATRPYVQPLPTFTRHAPSNKPITIGMAMARMNKPFMKLSWANPF